MSGYERTGVIPLSLVDYFIIPLGGNGDVRAYLSRSRKSVYKRLAEVGRYLATHGRG